MCLSVVYRGKQKKEALAELPESGYYWKVVSKRDNTYYPPYYSGTGKYINGWNKTKYRIDNSKYRIAYHIFRSHKDACRWLSDNIYFINGSANVIRVKVKKRDIVAIGKQNASFSNYAFYALTIVTTRFWCPRPR